MISEQIAGVHLVSLPVNTAFLSLYISAYLLLNTDMYTCIHIYGYRCPLYIFGEKEMERQNRDFIQDHFLITASVFCIQNTKQINFIKSFHVGQFPN